jgi:fructokinase
VIVVAGESLVDLMVQPGGELVPLPGGGPFNVARALARLDVPVAFLGAIAHDPFGAILRDALAGDGVDPRCFVDSDRPTMLAVAELDPYGAARYRFYAQGTAAASLTAEQARQAFAAVPAPRALHVGSLGLALEPVGEATEALVAATPRETLVMVDPNWRPQAAEDAHGWRERLERVLGRADIVKLSTDDLEHLAPGIEPCKAARGLLAGGARCVLLTDSDRDIRAFTRKGELRVVPPAASVVDTVGAGDAFGAGFLAWWWTFRLTRADLVAGNELRAAVSFAAQVAARACERPGADPPTLHELEAQLLVAG